MSRQIINEVVRIREIMLGRSDTNINNFKYRLTEAVVGGIDDLIELIIKSFDNDVDSLFKHNSDDVLNSIISSTKAKFPKDKTIRNIDNIQTLKNVYAGLDDVSKEFITKLIIKNSKGSLDNEIIENLAVKINFTSAEFEELVKAAKNSTEVIDDLQAPDWLRGVITRYFNKVHNVKEILSKSDIVKLVNAVKIKGGTYFLGDLLRAYNKSTDTIFKSIEDLNKEYSSKISSGVYSGEEIVKLTDAYSLAISRNLNMIEMQLNGGAIDNLNKLQLDGKIIDKLKNGEEDIFKIFRKLQVEAPGTFWDNFKEVNQNFWDSIKPKVGSIDIVGKKIPTISFDMSSQFKQFLVTGQWAKLSSLYNEAIKLNALGKTTMTVGNKTVNIPNVLKYIGKILYTSAIGTIIGGFLYAILNSIIIQLRIKKAMNKAATFMGTNPPFPNADKEYVESVTALGGLGAQFIIQFRKTLGNFEYLIPIIGSFNNSLLANVIAFAMGKGDAGISLGGLMEVIINTINEEGSSDEEEAIEEAIKETPIPEKDEQNGQTTDTDNQSNLGED